MSNRAVVKIKYILERWVAAPGKKSSSLSLACFGRV
jgi:hypothetical protein